MNCEQVLELGVDFVLGDIAGTDRSAVLAHLGHCGHCQTGIASLATAVDQLGALVPPIEPTDGFADRVSAKIVPPVPEQRGPEQRGPEQSGLEQRGLEQRGLEQRSPARKRSGPGRSSRRLVGAAAMVAILVGAVVGVRMFGGSGPDSTAQRPSYRLAALVTSSGTGAGQAMAFAGPHPWLAVSVDLPSPVRSSYPNGRYEVVVVDTKGRPWPVGAVAVHGGRGYLIVGDRAPLGQIGLVSIETAGGRPLCNADISTASAERSAASRP